MDISSNLRNSGERSDITRARILDAAIGEFSANGLAGARTERIADVAGVNKALLYYYFKGKEALYAASLESVAEGVRTASLAVLEGTGSAGERFLAYALNHFDRIYSNHGFQSLMQQEMVRLHRGEKHALSPLIERVFRPGLERMQQVLEEGSAAGELIAVDPAQIHYAAIGANVFYFLSAPMMQLIEGRDPLEESVLAFRRRSAVLFLGQALFVDRNVGAQVAERVLATTPIPAMRAFQQLRMPKFGFHGCEEVRHK